MIEPTPTAVKKRTSGRSLGSDLDKVDAHVITPEEYEEIPELEDEFFEHADEYRGGKLVRCSPLCRMEMGKWLRQTDASERERVASLCNTTVDYFYQIAGGHRLASPQLAGLIQKATNGAVTACELRPDLAAIFAPAEPAEKPVSSMTKAAAIDLFGSGTALARALDITRQAISEWPDGEIYEPRRSQITLLAMRRGLIPPVDAVETASSLLGREAQRKARHLQMKAKAQIIEANGKPQYAVVAYDDYVSLIEAAVGASPSIATGVVMTLGQRLFKARQRAEFTQQQLAEKSGQSQQMISKLESGQSKETAGIVPLALACGVRPEWLFNGGGSMTEADTGWG